MSEDDTLSPEDRQALIDRFGEYRHMPIAHCGPVRLDRVRHRHFAHAGGEIETPWCLVFEIDAASEFDLLGGAVLLWKMFRLPVVGGRPPTPAEMLRVATVWVDELRPKPDLGRTSIARYRRRAGPAAVGQEAAPGDWHIGGVFRPPDNPVIYMDEAVPLVEAALYDLERAETEGRSQAF